MFPQDRKGSSDAAWDMGRRHLVVLPGRTPWWTLGFSQAQRSASKEDQAKKSKTCQ
jgi:hypothetical protein